MAGVLAGAPLLFLNGAAADISTRYSRRGQTGAEVERFGDLLAVAAEDALASAQPIVGNSGSAQTTVALEGQAQLPVAELQREADRLAVEAARIATDAPAPARRRAQTRAEGAALKLAAARSGSRAPDVMRLTGAVLGTLALLGVPGELASGLGRAIEAGSPFPVTLILGYTNGYVGYIMDAAAHEARTYEALASPFADSAGRQIVKAAVALLQGLAADPQRTDDCRPRARVSRSTSTLADGGSTGRFGG